MEGIKIQICFNSLERRLNKIPNEQEPLTNLQLEYIISEIAENDLFSFENEELQEWLLYYIERIESILNTLPESIGKVEFTDVIKNTDDVFTQEVITGDTRRNQALIGFIKELEYYKSALNMLLERVVDRMDALGSGRFSNAGIERGRIIFTVQHCDRFPISTNTMGK